MAGWWFGTMELHDFPIILGIHNPNWQTNIFQMGWNHQTYYIYIYLYTLTTHVDILS